MTRRPNIVLSICDDQRYDLVAALGHPDLRTPTLDALLRRGTVFTHAFHAGSHVPAVCIASRAMLHTNRHVFHIPDDIRQTPWPDSLLQHGPRGQPETPELLGEQLRQAGYYCFGCGKWHNERASYARSFADGGSIFFGGMSDHERVPICDFDPDGVYPPEAERIDPSRRHSSELFAQTALDFIRRYDGDRPFFLYLAFTAPHDPRQAPPQYLEMYDPAKLTLSSNHWPQHPFDNGELFVRDELLEAFPRSEEAVRRHLRDYYAITTHMDHWLGRVHQAIEDRGLSDRTLVIHTADHGLAVGQHGLMGKQNLYEHSVRVPLLMAGPDVPRDRRCDALVYQHDLHPTILEFAGIAPPAGGAFETLWPYLASAPPSGRRSVFSFYRATQRMVRTSTHKLHTYLVNGHVRKQLFDLVADPWECNDLMGRPESRPTAGDLTSLLHAWQQILDDPCGLW